jgi:hypothetical protein
MNATTPPTSPAAATLRPVLGLLAGLGVTVLLVFLGVTVTTLAALRGVDPERYVAPFWTYPTHLAISVGAAALGGLTTARVTAGRSAFSVLLLALILLMSGLGPVLRGVPAAPGQPRWYPLALALLTPAGALVAGLLARRPGGFRSTPPA